ncbi:unnamed protein product, partial [Discosporangium mesarthrocarpum]
MNETHYSEEKLRDCFCRAMEEAMNPLVPGMNLSEGLAIAAQRGTETQRLLLSLKDDVDALRMEILERLPQTVLGFPRGWRSVQWMLEPEHAVVGPETPPGPLHKATTSTSNLEFFSSPLILDYICLKLTCGLPSLLNGSTTAVYVKRSVLQKNGLILVPLVNNEQPQWQVNGEHPRGVSDDDQLGGSQHPNQPRQVSWEDLFMDMVQGTSSWKDENGSRWWSPVTIFPGSQFVLAGLVGNPVAYYKVPIVRMTFDFMVHMSVVTFFCVEVLANDSHTPQPGDFIFLLYILGAGLTEVQEMLQETYLVYALDPWNKMDMLTIVLLLLGSIFRFSSYYEDPQTALAIVTRIMFAISAPLLFSRTLFYFQF